MAMRCARKLTNNMCLAGTFSLVCVLIFSCTMLNRGLSCDRGPAAPGDCGMFESSAAEDFFETRDGQVTTQLKVAGAAHLLSSLQSVPDYLQPADQLHSTDAVAELAEFNARAANYRPEHAFTYTPCSSRPGTPLSSFHQKVTNPTCQALGCGASECLEARFECNRAEGVPQTGAYPTLQCVMPVPMTEVGDWRFALCFMASLVSLGLCIIGCCQPSDPSDETMVKVIP